MQIFQANGQLKKTIEQVMQTKLINVPSDYCLPVVCH